MIHLKLLTSWTKEDMGGGELANTPVFPFMVEGDSWTDASATPSANLAPDPNLVLIEAWVSEETYSDILAHPDYGAEAVFMSEEMPEDDI